MRYASKGTNGQLFAARFLHAPDREPALEFIETSPRPARGAPILLIHGAFLGAWLGGLAVVNLGDYTVMWYLDAGLAALAALVNVPIREAVIAPKLQPV